MAPNLQRIANRNSRSAGPARRRAPAVRASFDAAIAAAVRRAKPLADTAKAELRAEQRAHLAANVAAWKVGGILEDLIKSAGSGRVRETVTRFAAGCRISPRTADNWRTLHGTVTVEEMTANPQIPRNYWLALDTLKDSYPLGDECRDWLVSHPILNAEGTGPDSGRMERVKHVFARLNRQAGQYVARWAKDVPRSRWGKVAPIYTPTKEDTEAYCVVVRQFQWEVSAIEEWDRTTPPLTVTQEEMAEYHRRADRWMFPKWSKDKRKPLDDWTADRTRQEWREAGDELTAKERKALWNPAHCCIEHCRFQDLQVKPHSATTIIADIPYDEKFITGNVKDLAEGCKDWLRPGGVAAIMGGGKWLDKIIDLMRAGGMFYRWQLCYWMKDSRGSPVPGVYPGVLLNQWKSITLFAPDRHPIESIHMDFIESDPADKRLHEWQQDEGGFLQLMENITPKRDVLVIDPVVGWGTTAICALRTGRRFVGCDIDKSRVADARLRCEAWWAGNPDERK